MHALSRAVIIAPIVIIVIAFVLFIDRKVNSLYAGSAKVKESISSTPPEKNPIAELFSGKSSSTSAQLNLKGPTVCSYKTTSLSISAWIKDKNVLAQWSEKNKNNSYLLKGDCLYTWENSTSGTKYCGISQYVSLFESFSSFGLSNITSLVGSLPKFSGNKSLPVSESVIQDALKTCKKQDFELKVFTIPKSVIFKEGSISQFFP